MKVSGCRKKLWDKKTVVAVVGVVAAAAVASSSDCNPAVASDRNAAVIAVAAVIAGAGGDAGGIVAVVADVGAEIVACTGVASSPFHSTSVDCWSCRQQRSIALAAQKPAFLGCRR